jgi:hypothetical protein
MKGLVFAAIDHARRKAGIIAEFSPVLGNPAVDNGCAVLESRPQY